MPLNRDDYPGLTDEQWTALNAEVDRARTEASNTAREKARKGMIAESDVDARVTAALDAERERLKMDEAQRLEADRKALEDQRDAFLGQQRTFKARTHLKDAGFADDKIESLLPLFAGVDDKALDATLNTFVTTHTESVKAQVDAEKVALLGGATPPANPTTGPVDANAAAVDAFKAGDDAAAVQALIDAAGAGPAQ